MSLTDKDVLRIAELSRLEITPAQVPRVQAQLNAVFALVEQLAAVDTAGIEPMTHVQAAGLRLRDDQVSEANRREDYLANAPAVQDGLFLVPKVIE